MGGHIWIESEGHNKGSTATFIVKLGISNNAVGPAAHTAAPRGRPTHGSADLAGHKMSVMVDTANPRYQRSL